MATVNYETDIVAWANEQAWLVRNRGSAGSSLALCIKQIAWTELAKSGASQLRSAHIPQTPYELLAFFKNKK